MKRMYLFLELQYDLTIWTVALSILKVNVSMPKREINVKCLSLILAGVHNVHRLVLSLHSDVVLMSRRSFLRVRSSSEVVAGLVKFMYTGRLEVPRVMREEYAKVCGIICYS